MINPAYPSGRGIGSPRGLTGPPTSVHLAKSFVTCTACQLMYEPAAVAAFTFTHPGLCPFCIAERLGTSWPSPLEFK